MGTLITDTIRFGCNTTASDVFHKQLSVTTDFVDSPARRERYEIFNRGEEEITIDVDGSLDDAAWVEIATLVVPAKTVGVMTVPFAISATNAYPYVRMQAYTTSTGESFGQVEVIEAADQTRR